MKGTLIRSVIVPLDNDSPVMEAVQPPGSTSGTISGWVRVEEGHPRVAHVSWAYAVNDDKYRDALQQQRP